MSDLFQKTISKQTEFRGIGLHSGLESKIKILPASFAILELGPVLGILMYLLSYPIICFNWLANNRSILGTKEAKQKCGKLYTNIAIYRSHNVIFYYPVFILRRLCFVLIPTLLANHRYLQI